MKTFSNLPYLIKRVCACHLNYVGQEKSAQLLTYLYWSLWLIKSKELQLAVFDKFCGKNPVQLWFCVKLASKRFVQLWFFLKCASFVNNRRKTLKLCKAVLDKTCNKQRAQPRCCSKLAPSHTTQLSFCFKLARIVTKVKLEKNTVRIFPVTQNWRQNTLQNCRFT